MDREELKVVFDELLKNYQDAEETVINEFGSGVPGRTIQDELDKLQLKIRKIKERFYKALGN